MEDTPETMEEPALQNGVRTLVVPPPVAPMLAKPHSGLPPGEDWLFEPKWDGFRTIVFRSGGEVELGSRNERPMTRYFPELMQPLREALPDRCVVDGEIVIETDGVLDFEALQQRIHPADSRVRMLAGRIPATIVLFDLLAVGEEDLRAHPFIERRTRLGAVVRENTGVRLTPATRDRAEAEDWFVRFESAGCDGLIAKRTDQRYVENQRTMVKIKHERTADCVVAGMRWHKDGVGVVGSLLLGIFDREGRLNHVGVTAAFTAKRRRELALELEPLTHDVAEGHPWAEWIAHHHQQQESAQRLPGAVSRWNAGKDLSFVPLRAERVVEVAFDHLQQSTSAPDWEGARFRHATTFRRWRPDREPRTCTYDQFEVQPRVSFTEVIGALPQTSPRIGA